MHSLVILICVHYYHVCRVLNGQNTAGVQNLSAPWSRSPSCLGYDAGAVKLPEDRCDRAVDYAVIDVLPRSPQKNSISIT